ncbi:MAG TPA: hypothetical protein VK971_08650 [Thiohalobacter sp.]|nr:hypothetical protein [Thiohalobacter sp.]
MPQQYVNNWRTALTAQALAGDGTMTVPAADAALISNASAEDFYLLTLEDDQDNREIVRVTAANGVTGEMTVTRAQEGFSARDWPSGSLIEMRVTAQTLRDLQFDPDDILTDGSNVLVGNDGNVLTQ